MPAPAEKGPRLAPEIQLVDKLIAKAARIGELLDGASLRNSVLQNVTQKLQTVDKKLDEMIQREGARVQGIVVFEAPKSPSKEARRLQRALDRELKHKTPGEILAGIPGRERKPKKSRGLKGERPILFEDTTGVYRGKVGFTARALSERRRVSSSNLALALAHGVKRENARSTVGRAVVALRKRGWKIETEVDREKNETYYVRKTSPRKRK